jgi:hypothetical protein
MVMPSQRTRECLWQTKFTKIFRGVRKGHPRFFRRASARAGAPWKNPGGEAQDRGVKTVRRCQLCPTSLRRLVITAYCPHRRRPERTGVGVWLTHYYQRSGLSFPINWFISNGPGLYPTVDAEQRDELAADHSITSSARASSVGGTLRPSALAVLRLRTSPYLVGACTGRSAGFSPLRMRST